MPEQICWRMLWQGIKQEPKACFLLSKFWKTNWQMTATMFSFCKITVIYLKNVFVTSLEQLFSEVVDQRCFFIEKRFRLMCYQLNFARFFRTDFFIEHLRIADSVNLRTPLGKYVIFQFPPLALQALNPSVLDVH